MQPIARTRPLALASIFLLVLGAAAGFLLSSLGVHADPPPKNVLSLERLECREIVLKAPGSDHSIRLQVDANIGGIWISSAKTGRCLAIYETDGQVAYGIYHDQRKASACNAALSIDDKGKGLIQLDDSRGVRSIGGDDLPRPVAD